MPATPISQEALIARARARDPEALGELYARFAKSLMAVAYGITGAPADAEDVLHDVFVGLPDALRLYREQGELGPWLRRVTARVALSRLRSRERRREVALDAGPEPRTDGSAPQFAEEGAVQRAVARLPDSLRSVFLLRAIDDCSHAEIARMLEITPGASEVRLHRAISLLRQQLRASSPGST